MRNSKDLFLSFGFDTQPVLIGLMIFQVFCSTISQISMHQFYKSLRFVFRPQLV